eukprot:6206747-Pleurochrysis_carterae.AAC.7
MAGVLSIGTDSDKSAGTSSSGSGDVSSTMGAALGLQLHRVCDHSDRASSHHSALGIELLCASTLVIKPYRRLRWSHAVASERRSTTRWMEAS